MQQKSGPIQYLFFRGFLVTLLFAFFLSAQAATEQDLRGKIETKNQEIQKLEEEIKQYQDSVKKAGSVAQTLQSEVNRINQEVKNLNYQIKLTQTKIAKKELEIKELGEEINETIASILEQQQALQETLRQLNDLENQSFVEIFLQYKTISSFFDAIEKNRSLEAAVKELHDRLVQTKTTLETKKGAAENTRKQLLNLKDDLTDQRALEEDAKAEKAQLLKATKNEEVRYQKLLRDREQRRTEILKEMQTIEDELRRLIDPSLLPSKGSGVLLWPVANPQLTQEFGVTAFSQSTDVYKGKFHNGIDFRAGVGTALFAAGNGVVKNVGDTDTICPRGSYGKWVVIEHPNNLSTLYAHLSRIKVVAGQTVSRGDIIGLSGNTGYTTGPHLHFTVYASNTFRQAKTVHCGLIPAGGYINPFDYL